MKRWLIYLFTGLLFGVVDWYYLDLLAHFPWGPLGRSLLVIPLILALNYGFWLVPVFPIVYLEVRRSASRLKPVLAGVLTWSSAIFGYYAFYALLLSLGKLPQLEHLSLFGPRYPGFWNEWYAMFQRIILYQFLEWIFIAIIGGALIAALETWLVRIWLRRRQKGKPAGELSHQL